MNYSVSYRHLLQNAKAAMLAAIEIYNKPCFTYRDECFCILFLNAWELILKALISKNRESIYYPKKPNEAYKTLSCRDAFARAEKYFPKNIRALPVRKNLEFLTTYRDNAVHFYNTPGFGTVIYSLSQTGIINFRDLMAQSFDIHFEEEITWNLMPLGFHCPVDVITYMSDDSTRQERARAPVKHFLSELVAAQGEVEKSGIDTGRLMTVFKVKLESMKKAECADIVAGVESDGDRSGTGPLVIEKRFDPNDPNWIRRKEILKEITELHGKRFTSHTFNALVWHQKIKDNQRLCWVSHEGVLTKYSREIIAIFRRLTSKQIEAALAAYREHMRQRHARRPTC